MPDDEYPFDVNWWQFAPVGIDLPAFLIAQIYGTWCVGIFDEKDNLIYFSPGSRHRKKALDMLWTEAYKRYKTYLDDWAIEYRKTH